MPKRSKEIDALYIDIASLEEQISKLEKKRDYLEALQRIKWADAPGSGWERVSFEGRRDLQPLEECLVLYASPEHSWYMVGQVYKIANGRTMEETPGRSIHGYGRAFTYISASTGELIEDNKDAIVYRSLTPEPNYGSVGV